MLKSTNYQAFPLTPEKQKLLKEYFRLALLSKLSSSEGQRMSEIIEMTQKDKILEFWLSEADHIIGHKLNLIDENECKNQQAKLQEYLDAKYLEIKHLTSKHF